MVLSDSGQEKHGASGKVMPIWKGMKFLSGWVNTDAEGVGMGFWQQQWCPRIAAYAADVEIRPLACTMLTVR